MLYLRSVHNYPYRIKSQGHAKSNFSKCVKAAKNYRRCSQTNLRGSVQCKTYTIKPIHHNNPNKLDGEKKEISSTVIP